MRNPKRTFWGFGLFVLLAGALALPQGVAADSHEGPAYFVVHYDQVDPAKTAAHEANSKKWVEAFKAGDFGPEWTWYAYSNSNFGYGYVFPFPNYAYLDGAEAREKSMAAALGEEKMAELMAGTGTVLAHHSEVWKAKPSLSYAPPGGNVPGGFARVGVHHVKPNKMKDFEALVGRVVEAYKKANAAVGFDGYEIEFGQGSYGFVSFAKDAGTFYTGPNTGQVLTQALGAEAAQALFQEWGECLTAYETEDWTVRPDLSYVPEMEAEGAETEAEGAAGEETEGMEAGAADDESNGDE